ncbi:MAG TPA: M14 family metallopeptidase, partial [Longimicrobiales bacterium]|nr:M14 family metallopeptidase [Longimicrobiales bacterium]
MRVAGCRGVRAAGVVAALAGIAPIGAAGVQAQATSYLDFDGLTDEIQAIADGSGMASVESIATSPGGRDVWLLTIADPSDGPVEGRPGVLVVGNLEGDHVVGSHLVLEAARYLVSGDADASATLQDHVFYLVPRLNPDGAEAMFADVLGDRPTNGRPWDDDNDGRVDEDGPEDLNGDGVITVMRVPDPLGDYLPHPDDPRLMVEADAAERQSGQYVLHWEGVDSDGDGFINEDGPGGVDLNRNFQHEYPYYGAAAGPHMVSEPESRGLMDFVIAHRNIAAIVTFGHTDNLVTPPNNSGNLADPSTLDLMAFADASNDDVFGVGVYAAGTAPGVDLRGAQPGRDNEPESGRRPATTVNRADVEYFEAVSDLYRESTGIEQVGLNRRAEGAFFQYGYYQYGVPSFSTQGWALPEVEEGDEEGGEEGVEGTDGEVLAALTGAGIDAFVEWTPFDHPDLGDVEIGGFRPYATTNPPADRLPDLGRAHGEFVVGLAGMLSRVSIVDTEVESHGGGLYTVTAQVANTGYFPTAMQHGVVARAVDPLTVQIQVPPEDVVTGDSKTSQLSRLEGSGTRERFTW